jgi:chitinase
VSIDDPVIFTEGAADGTSFVTIRLDQAPAPGASVTVNFTLEGITAKVGDDIKLHDPTMMSVTFEGDEKTKTIAFDVIDDTISEGGETFKITLSSVTGALIPVGNVTRIGTINDNGDPLPTVKILDAQITEGDSGTKDMTFTVKLTEAAGQPVTVRVATENVTATAGTILPP